jgi:hypothetical protein
VKSTAREELAAPFAAAVTCRLGGTDPGGTPAVGSASTRALAPWLDERRSARTFAAAPISEAVLGTVVDAGLAVDRELWSPDPDLRVLILAARVDPLGPGVYEYASGLVLRAPLATLADHVFQPDLAAAAAVIVLCGDLDAAVRRHGPHGYRRLLTRAGAVAAACQLAAQRAGLAGCPFDGLLPEGPGPVRDLSLFALALGRPGPGAGPDPASRRD